MKDGEIKKIDSLLTEDFDLGHIVNYLDGKQKIVVEGKEFESPYWLSIVDVLRQIPEFNNEVKQFRNKHGIRPHVLSDEISKILGTDIYNDYVKKTRGLARGLFLPSLSQTNKIQKINNLIDNWERQKFPKISDEILKMEIFTNKKLDKVWHTSIKNYILYDRITLGLVQFRKHWPEMKIKFDRQTYQTYIEVKVYSHTTLHGFKIKYIEDLRRNLPDYYDPNKKNEITLLSRFLYYVLKKNAKLSNNQINKWLVLKQLDKIDDIKSSREVKRFLNDFINTSK